MTIVTCTKCIPHAFQDKRYGDKRRVMNPVKSEFGNPVYRCTVCGQLTAKITKTKGA